MLVIVHESVNHFREDSSRSREAARQNLPAESVNRIREDNSRYREQNCYLF